MTLRDIMRKAATAAYKRKWTARLWVLTVVPIGFLIALPIAVCYALKEAGEAFIDHECWYDLKTIAGDAVLTFRTGLPRSYGPRGLRR